MNVYDQAHQLATAIKESEECKQYSEVRKKLEANPELDSAVKDFMKKQFEFQTNQMMGNEIDQEEFLAKTEEMISDSIKSEFHNSLN